MALIVLAVGMLCGIASLALTSLASMEAAGHKISATAAAIETAKIITTADSGTAVDDAAHATRSVVPNAAVQYLLMQETQRHLVRASEALEKENYTEAATEMRNASSYMRLEAASATGNARQELHTTLAKLDELATAIR
jgi:hypothetical protein